MFDLVGSSGMAELVDARDLKFSTIRKQPGTLSAQPAPISP
jgi:hypothetical protein